MRWNTRRVAIVAGYLCLILAAGLSNPSFAGKAEAEDAMTMIMFETEEIQPEEIVFTVNKKGVVNVTFDDGVPEPLVDGFIDKLRAHPDISGANVNSANICKNVVR